MNGYAVAIAGFGLRWSVVAWFPNYHQAEIEAERWTAHAVAIVDCETFDARIEISEFERD